MVCSFGYIQRINAGAKTKYFLYVYSLFLVWYMVRVLISHPRIYLDTMLQDVFIFQDGIYRVSLGQIPHLDYHTPLGAFCYYLPIIAGNIPSFGPTIQHGLALLTILFALMAVRIAVTRLDGVVGFLYVTYVVLMLAAPATIQAGGDEVTFAMFYNRIGYAFLILLIGYFKKTIGECDVKIDIVYFIISGFLLLHLKVSYFAAWGGIILLLFMSRPELRRAIFISLLLLFGICLVMFWSVPEFYFAYWKDIGESAIAKAGSVDVVGRFWKVVGNNYIYLSVVVGSAWIVARNDAESTVGRLIPLVVSVAIFFGSVLIYIGNYQRQLFVLPEIFVLVLATQITHGQSEKRRDGRLSYALLLLLSLLYIGPEMLNRISATRTYWRNENHPIMYTFPVPTELSSRFIVREARYSLFYELSKKHSITIGGLREYFKGRNPRQEIFQEDYLYSVGRGVEVLKEVQRQFGRGSVVTFDFSNPFPYLMALPPSSGDYLWYHDGVNISHGNIAPAAAVVGGAKYILIPEVPARVASRDFLVDEFGDYVITHFELLYHDEMWLVWGRR